MVVWCRNGPLRDVSSLCIASIMVPLLLIISISIGSSSMVLLEQCSCLG